MVKAPVVLDDLVLVANPHAGPDVPDDGGGRYLGRPGLENPRGRSVAVADEGSWLSIDHDAL